MKKLPVKKNSGRDIILYASIVKTLIIICGIIASLPYFLGGILLNNALGKDESVWILLLSFAIGIAVIVIGYWLARIIAAFISGYGEVVENSAEIATGINYLCAKNGAVLGDQDLIEMSSADQTTPSVQLNRVRVYSDAVHVENATGVSVNCPYCRTAVPYGSNNCTNCRKNFVFVPFKK